MSECNILGTKISQLQDGIDLQGSDLFVIARGTDNKSIKGSIIVTKAQLDAAIADAHTNLGNTPNASTVVVSSSTGTSTTLPAATTSAAGVMTAADKAKLDSAVTSVPSSAGTNLGNTPNASTVVVSSSTGTSTTLPAATTSAAGVMTAADKAKLNSLTTGGGSPSPAGKTWDSLVCSGSSPSIVDKAWKDFKC